MSSLVKRRVITHSTALLGALCPGFGGGTEKPWPRGVLEESGAAIACIRGSNMNTCSAPPLDLRGSSQLLVLVFCSVLGGCALTLRLRVGVFGVNGSVLKCPSTTHN